MLFAFAAILFAFVVTVGGHRRMEFPCTKSYKIIAQPPNSNCVPGMPVIRHSWNSGMWIFPVQIRSSANRSLILI